MEGCEAVMSLGFGSALVSKTIAEFITRISSIGNVQKRMSKVDEYVGCLEEEMRKIHAFKRELPLCMFLLSDAIVYLKEQSKRWCKRGSGEVEKPLLKEIDLLKESEMEAVREITEGGDYGDKKSWMSSFQLWNSDLNPAIESTKLVKQKAEEASKPKMGELFQTLESKKENVLGSLTVSSTFPVVGVAWKEEKKQLLTVPEMSLVPPVANSLVQKSGSTDLRSSVAEMVAPSGSRGIHNSRNAMLMPHQQQQSCRKQRRCWSPELHKTFVCALQKLGGPQAATPKQIRDLMRVDGLTNDEVKSHLQKYRLHIRRVRTKETVLGVSWNNQDESGESSKHTKDSESGSPPGPLELYVHPRGNSLSGGDNMEPNEDENYSSDE